MGLGSSRSDQCAAAVAEAVPAVARGAPLLHELADLPADVVDRDEAQVVGVRLEHDRRDPGVAAQADVDAGADGAVLRGGPRVVEQRRVDAVPLELPREVLHLPLARAVRVDGGVGRRHALDGVVAVQPLERVALRVPGPDHRDPLVEEEARERAQRAPDRHPLPVEAQPLAGDRGDLLGDAVLQLGAEDLVVLDRLLGPAHEQHGRDVDERVEVGERARRVGGEVEDLVPEPGGARGAIDHLGQAILVERAPGDLLEPLDEPERLLHGGVHLDLLHLRRAPTAGGGRGAGRPSRLA